MEPKATETKKETRQRTNRGTGRNRTDGGRGDRPDTTRRDKTANKDIDRDRAGDLRNRVQQNRHAVCKHLYSIILKQKPTKTNQKAKTKTNETKQNKQRTETATTRKEKKSE